MVWCAEEVLSSESSPTVTKEKFMKLQQSLKQERERSDMWRRLYMTEKAEFHRYTSVNTSMCLAHLRQQVCLLSPQYLA